MCSPVNGSSRTPAPSSTNGLSISNGHKSVDACTHARIVTNFGVPARSGAHLGRVSPACRTIPARFGQLASWSSSGRLNSKAPGGRGQRDRPPRLRKAGTEEGTPRAGRGERRRTRARPRAPGTETAAARKGGPPAHLAPVPPLVITSTEPASRSHMRCSPQAFGINDSQAKHGYEQSEPRTGRSFLVAGAAHVILAILPDTPCSPDIICQVVVLQHVPRPPS